MGLAMVLAVWFQGVVNEEHRTLGLFLLLRFMWRHFFRVRRDFSEFREC